MEVCPAGMDLKGIGLCLENLITWRWIERLKKHARSRVQLAGANGVIIRLQLVKSAEDARTEKCEKDHLHSTAVTLRLVEPWTESGGLVCGDSAFSSVRIVLTLI